MRIAYTLMGIRYDINSYWNGQPMVLSSGIVSLESFPKTLLEIIWPIQRAQRDEQLPCWLEITPEKPVETI